MSSAGSHGLLALRIGLAFAGWIFMVGAAGAAEPELPGPSLGVALSGAAVPETLAAADAAHPIDVRVIGEWSAVETAAGVFDWSSVEPVLDPLAARGARITLCVRGESPLHPRVADPRALPDVAWLQSWA